MPHRVLTDLCLTMKYKITSHRIILRQQSAITVPVTAPSKAWVCGRAIAGIVGSNPAGVMYVSWERCVSGRGLCDGPTTRLEKSSQVWYECDRGTSTLRRPWPTRAIEPWGKKKVLDPGVI